MQQVVVGKNGGHTEGRSGAGGPCQVSGALPACDRKHGIRVSQGFAPLAAMITEVPSVDSSRGSQASRGGHRGTGAVFLFKLNYALAPPLTRDTNTANCNKRRFSA